VSASESRAESYATRPTVYRADLFVGQTVLVSGGGSGIGKAIGFLFGRLGARVAICGRKAREDRIGGGVNA